MTKKSKITITLSIVLAIVLIAGVGVYAATNYGTSEDPLITLSYLKNTLTPELLKQFDNQLNNAVSDLETYIDAGSSAETYKVVTLSKGQVLKGSVGCEIMLRVGTANVSAADSPGLVNVTSGGTLNNGSALVANNLYLVSIEGNGITATAASTKVLVRGNYAVK